MRHLLAHLARAPGALRGFSGRAGSTHPRRAGQAAASARLYTHQRHAIESAMAGRDIVVVTPTASGKTMCYNLPVLNAILKDDIHPRALSLPHQGALQRPGGGACIRMIEEMGVDVKAYTYDGDTPAAARTAVRLAGHVVVTNPDMLHQGILPNHTQLGEAL